MIDADIKITKQFEDARILPGGTMERQIHVQFFVGSHGPFSVRVPLDESYSAQRRDDAVNTFARELRIP